MSDDVTHKTIMIQQQSRQQWGHGAKVIPPTLSSEQREVDIIILTIVTVCDDSYLTHSNYFSLFALSWNTKILWWRNYYIPHCSGRQCLTHMDFFVFFIICVFNSQHTFHTKPFFKFSFLVSSIYLNRISH